MNLHREKWGKAQLSSELPDENAATHLAATHLGSDIKARILVVSPFEADGRTYPQIAHFAKWLKSIADVSWLVISERGFRIDRLFDETIRSCDLRKTTRSLIKLSRDIASLWNRANESEVVIAIDFMALVLADFVCPCPVVFWSHDFISRDDQRAQRKINQSWLALVRRAILKRPRIIIQDEDRLRALCRSLALPNGALDYCEFPVSLPPVDIRGEGPFQSLCARPVVMQIGGLNAWRSNTDFLLACYQEGRGEFDLFLHGEVDEDIGRYLSQMERPPVVNTVLVNPDRLQYFIARCSIGFVSYAAKDEQFYFLKNASGQLVEFLRCGKPVISMGHNNIGERLEEAGAGHHILNSADFFEALKKISRNYTNYSMNALKLYQRYYNMSDYTSRLIKFCTGALTV